MAAIAILPILLKEDPKQLFNIENVTCILPVSPVAEIQDLFDDEDTEQCCRGGLNPLQNERLFILLWFT